MPANELSFRANAVNCVMPFNGRFVSSFIQFASARGARPNDLLVLSGHDFETLQAEATQISTAAYGHILEQAVAQTDDNYLGLHFGEFMNMAAAGIVAQITMTSETVKQGLEYACEFAQLACSALPMQLTEAAAAYRLSMVPDPVWLKQSPSSVRHTIDGTLVFTLNEYFELTRKRHYPIEVHLTIPRPADPSEYHRVLNCPVLFNQPETALYFRKEHIEQKILTSDYRLLRILVAHAEERIAAMNQQQGFYDTVRQSVAHLVKPEFPTIEQVAQHLNISVRTLQRKLSEEGHTFKQIIESLREDFALSYLKRPELSINEIAYLLNYGDASAFIRSFKRWKGMTPNQYRSQH